MILLLTTDTVAVHLQCTYMGLLLGEEGLTLALLIPGGAHGL